MKNTFPSCTAIFLLVVAAWIAMPLPVCLGAPSAAKEDPVALVNGDSIDKKAFDAEFEQAMSQIKARGQSPNEEDVRKIKESVLNNLINLTLLFQESKKKKIEVNQDEVANEWNKLKARFPDEKEFQKKLDEVKMTEKDLKEKILQSFAVQKLIETEVVKDIVISPKELKDFYDSQPELFEQPEQVRASHILIKVEPDADEKTRAAAMEKIKGVQAELKKGADFTELARANSDCPSAANGGDLNYFRRGQMVKPFEDAAFSMKPNEISDVVTTQFGYHLIRTVDKKTKGKAALEEIKPQLEGHLKQRKAGEAVDKYIEQLKSRAKIKTLLKI